ncbi:14186_t:CDS:2 [Entrophospora sp. SA101]|nr:14186_t:CDS:2 [Entrophospora sp. SA101]CAJ0835220.1 9813_t:CDS:2 [Entrophospora sp. SA101]CAJ0841865.1 8468_t:CDS:2 [Entrophospora sp. SA101]
MVEGPILAEGIGWGVVVGFGAFFAVFMSLLTIAQKRYLQEYQTSEMFMTAHRSVKTGLVASAVVSSWTWAATLLQSSSVAYRYGVSGPFWYASGATIQVLLFAILAIEVKRKAPNAHTFLEIINVRYGKATHIVFLCFGLITNMIVTAMLLLGGSAVVNALTGVNVFATCFLLPIGVMFYTFFGGIKATFLTDYVHTTVIFIIILTFVFTVYSTSPIIGSPSKMHELLSMAAQKNPVTDNEGGEYVTMSSLQGLIFGIINIVGNFGTVFVDNAYWQRAIAARPSSTVKAYLIGGLAWFAIPFTLATTMGIAGVALVASGNMDPLTEQQIDEGLVLPLAAASLLGSPGAVAVLVLVFMAAPGKKVINQSHYSVVAFGIIMGVLATILHFIGISLGYLYLLMGILCSPAVIPVAFTITWKKQTKSAAVGASIIGLVCGVVSWLATAQGLFGELTITTTGHNYPMLAGNLVSLGMSGLVATIWSLISPDNFDFNITKNQLEILTDDEVSTHAIYDDPIEHDPARLRKAFIFSIQSSVVLTIILVIIWPLPMYFSRYVFSVPFFTFWVAISMIWAIMSTLAVAIYPLYESRSSIANVVGGMYGDITGKRKPVTETKRTESEPSTSEKDTNQTVA